MCHDEAQLVSRIDAIAPNYRRCIGYNCNDVRLGSLQDKPPPAKTHASIRLTVYESTPQSAGSAAATDRLLAGMCQLDRAGGGGLRRRGRVVAGPSRHARNCRELRRAFAVVAGAAGSRIGRSSSSRSSVGNCYPIASERLDSPQVVSRFARRT